jgi:membrane protein insertase Oxa1/YidC/SpoIIIJ
MDIFHVLFYVPVFNALMFFANNLGNLGWAIIIIAGITKLITYPLTKGQIDQAAKSKELQSQVKAIQKKYKFNQEVMTKELAKVQAKALPGQLKGCFSMIIFIVFFFQIRGTIVDLVNQGYHSFNTIAYSESLKKKEDSILINFDEKLVHGQNNIKIELEASNGTKFTKEYAFEVVDNTEWISKRLDQIKEEELNKSENQRKAEADIITKQTQDQRTSDIAVYNKKLNDGLKSIAIKSFLIFPTESVQRTIIADDSQKFEFYLRPPLGATILADNTKITINGVDVTSKVEVNQGEEMMLYFFGMNLAMVAADFNIFDLQVTLPYIVVALISAFTQYAVTNIYSATNVTTTPLPDDEKKKGDKKKVDKTPEKEPDMAEAMTDSLKLTNKFLPIFTFALSLGYLGGASLLPTGVTLFWTAQNTFVIIQQGISNRKMIYNKLKSNLEKLKNKFTKINNK